MTEFNRKQFNAAMERPYYMMKEVGSTKRHIMKGRALKKNTAMQCPVCKQTKELDPNNPWHFGKAMCCPDCKPVVAGPRGIRSDVPHMDPADDLHPAVNAMVQGQEVGKMIVAGVDHGKFIQDDTNDGYMFLRRGSPVTLIDSDGKEIGQAVIRGDGELDVLEEPLDIKMGKSFWAVVGTDRGDPSVCLGKVMAFYFKHHEDEAHSHTVIHLRLENGHIVWCSDKHLFETQEAAEAGRMRILEASRYAPPGVLCNQEVDDDGAD